MKKMEEHHHAVWRSRLKKRRGKAFKPIAIRELNLVAMMDMLTILLVFLLKSYTVSSVSIPVGEEINIPISKNQLRPPEAVKVTVTKGTKENPAIIAVDENRVVQLDPNQMTTLEAQARNRKFMIEPLHRAMMKKADEIKGIAKLNPNVKFDGKVLVIADKQTPYWLITQVLYTAAEAQFDQYQLVAMKEGGD